MNNASIPLAKKLAMASRGVHTMGSWLRLKLVLSKTPVPVFFLN